MSVKIFPHRTGTPILSDEILFAYNGPDYSHTGNTTQTTILTVTIPGGIMGINDMIEVEHFWWFSGNTETRTCLVAAGGSLQLHNKSGQASTTDTNQSKSFMRNNGSLSAQTQMHGIIGTTYEFSGTVPATGTINTAADFDITFDAQLGTDGSDTIYLQGVKISLVRAYGIAS